MIAVDAKLRVGYHFAVDCVGRVWEARSLAYEGAHVLGANAANIGIMLLGNFEKQYPSLAQLASMERLVQLLQRYYAVPSTRVFGHRDLGPSLCPGEHLYPRVHDLRRA